ncbi:hemolysin D [Bradyrhizobium erythrophlei]|jgi:hemolysin D|nr:hemolysin D [Bradyrhizobium erythrophlei]
MTTAVVPVSTKPVRRVEREFLPAALEIVETPPSPIGRLGAYCLVAVFTLAFVWSWIGRVDIVAVSKGKIIPTGHTKIVQPFEIGVVRAIEVHDGQKVKVGDVLIELDPTMNQADLDHQRNDLMAAKLDIARLTAALESETNPEARFVPPEGATPEQARMGQQFLAGQVLQYRSKLAALAGEEAQKRAELESQKVSIGKIQTLLPLMEERTQMRKTLYDHQTGSKLAYLENLQELLSSQQDLEVQASRLKEAEAAVTAAEAKVEETRAEFHRQNLNDLAEATRKANGLAQDVAKSDQRTKLQALTAPIDGTVQQLAVHSVGGVVTPAQTLLSIVPADSKLEIEAMVDNQDIGFVHAGQYAEIKVDTFNFTRYGLLHGKVVTLSQDAIPRDGAGKSDPPKQPGAGDGATSEPAYAARVWLDQTQMQVDDKLVNLSPGMAVTVEIKTGTRRIIDYLLSPILRHSQESLRER